MMELQEGVNKQDVSSRAERSTFHSCSISKSLMYGKAPKEYLSLWSVIALGIGSMVGAGIFALMGQLPWWREKTYIGPLFWEELLPCFPGTPTPNWVPVIPVLEELWIISMKRFPIRPCPAH